MNFLDKTSDALLRLDKFTAFLTVGDSKSVNPMTIGWASFGIACGKPVLSVMIRQSRFSKQLIDSNPVFTVSIPRDGSYKAALGICGSKSGRDADKMALCSLKEQKADVNGISGIENCLMYECKVIYKTEMEEGSTVPAMNAKWYKDGNYHTIYTGEILNIKGE